MHVSRDSSGVERCQKVCGVMGGGVGVGVVGGGGGGGSRTNVNEM